MKKWKILMVVLCLLLIGCKKEEPSIEELLDQGDYDAAIMRLDAAIKKEENMAESYRGLGMAYWELGDLKRARGAFEYALAYGVEETGIICNIIGVCDLQLGNIESAKEWFEKGISKEGNSRELAKEMEFNQIVVCEKLEDWEGAKEKLASYVSKYPEDEQAKKEADFLETR